MSIIEQAKAALDELATLTPDEIAENLAADGLLRCGSVASKTCPIWQYLADRTGSGTELSGPHLVGRDYVTIVDVWFRNPESVRDFIHNFDNGLYDYLRNDKED